MVVDETPRPRLCHVTKWNNFDGYGFNLHAEKNKPGQYIGKVDAGSPADAAGLKEGDKIIEVNGVNISQENHKQVVQRIKANPDETRLLVVDLDTEKYHKDKNIIITSQLKYVHYISSDKKSDYDEHIDTTIQSAEAVDGGRDSPDSVGSLEDAAKLNLQREDSHKAVEREDSLLSDRTVSNRSSVSSGQGANSISSGSPRSTPSPVEVSKMTALRKDGLDLPLTAREMRERIVSKKKKDPRREDRMDFRKKFEIIQTL